MRKPAVFVSRIIAKKALNLIHKQCQLDLWTDELPPTRDVLLRRVKGCEGILSLLTDSIDEQLLQSTGPQLKVISNHAVGFDNIDVKAATRLGIPIGNTPGILTETTADFTFTLLLASARRLKEGWQAVIDARWKTWSPLWLLGTDVYGATLGIIGFGRIGQAVARRAAGFEMRILFHDPSPPMDWQACGVKAEPVDLDTLLAQSDFISIHTRLDPETRGLVDADFLSKMQPHSVLINTSRGPVVDQQALYAALKDRQIAGAALDVTNPEPLPADSPLLGLDNLIVTPHIASASRATRERMALMAAENLIAGVQGERLPYCVNPEVYKG